MNAVPAASPWVRALWVAAGGVACGLGFLGLLLPGMPATVFFILGAAAFTRSSPRLLGWVLSLPKVGAMVRDYREGLGMPRSAKRTALMMMLGFGGVSVWTVSTAWVRVLIAVLLAVGVWYVGWRVPTRPAWPDGETPGGR